MRISDWSSDVCSSDLIVCHCELVTRREIEAALAGPLPARSLAGLKRRTRVTMGRCQGFYCLGALAEITDGHFAPELALADAEQPCGQHSAGGGRSRRGRRRPCGRSDDHTSDLP